MSYEYFYGGSSYPLDSESGELFSGFRAPASSIGITTDPRSANQIREVANKLNIGGKVIEISAIQPRIFEAIPEQHLDEIRRISKLTGSEVTVHGILAEPSGIIEGGWSEAIRQQTENNMWLAVERSHKLSDNGNIPVTFHSSVGPPWGEEKMKIKGEEVPRSMVIIDPQRGRISSIMDVEKYFPEEGAKEVSEGKRKFDPQRELKRINRESWNEALSDINFYATRGEEFIGSVIGRFREIPEEELPKEIKEIPRVEEREKKILEMYSLVKNKPEILDKLPEIEKQIVKGVERGLGHAEPFLRRAYDQLRELYNRAYRDADKEDRRKLDDYAKKIKEKVDAGIERDPTRLQEFAGIIEDGAKVLGAVTAPRLFKPLNEFLWDKSSQTFAEVAWRAYDKFKDKAPMITIENPPAGSALSTAGELKKLIESSRDKFVEKAVEKGVSKNEAEKIAEKMIGATWDVGHINMLRRYGYDKADIVKQTEEIAPFVKHVHLSDNFGHEHTELPMGMGNVPLKEMMEKLEKEGKLKTAKKIIETGDWWQHFQTAPNPYVLEAFGSPVYSMLAAPYWNQIRATYGNYFAGYGTILPEQHFSLYGGGFSALPTELGGEMPGGRQRLSGGTPMG